MITITIDSVGLFETAGKLLKGHSSRPLCEDLLVNTFNHQLQRLSNTFVVKNVYLANNCQEVII